MTGYVLRSLVFSLIIVGSWPAAAQTAISAADARKHIGETATVCGQVASAHYGATTRGRPTFLNLDSAYPNQVFTVVIWGSDRSKFGDPEQKYASKRICVTGPITEYRGVPEQVAHSPSQVRIQ